MTREYRVDCKLKAFFEAKVRRIQRKEIRGLGIAKGSRSRNKYSLWRNLKMNTLDEQKCGGRESPSFLCLFFVAAFLVNV